MPRYNPKADAKKLLAAIHQEFPSGIEEVELVPGLERAFLGVVPVGDHQRAVYDQRVAVDMMVLLEGYSEMEALEAMDTLIEQDSATDEGPLFLKFLDKKLFKGR